MNQAALALLFKTDESRLLLLLMAHCFPFRTVSSFSFSWRTFRNILDLADKSAVCSGWSCFVVVWTYAQHVKQHAVSLFVAFNLGEVRRRLLEHWNSALIQHKYSFCVDSITFANTFGKIFPPFYETDNEVTIWILCSIISAQKSSLWTISLKKSFFRCNPMRLQSYELIKCKDQLWMDRFWNTVKVWLSKVHFCIKILHLFTDQRRNEMDSKHKLVEELG